MNRFSDKEYQNLKIDAAEIRAGISRYIGYIISITGVSGIVKFYFDEQPLGIGTVTLFFLALVVLTLLYEVVWYKFKSHNRLVGYMQLLMQEIDAIPFKKIKKKEHWGDKKYLKKWRSYNVKAKQKRVTDFFGWEFVMSRLNSNILFEKEKEPDLKIKDYTDAINKCKYIFSLPKQWIPYTVNMDCRTAEDEPCDRDVEFFTKITLPIYFENNSLSFKSNYKDYFNFIFNAKEKSKPLKDIAVEDRYLVYGWEYPRKITQIAFTAVLILYTFLIIFLIKNYRLIDSFKGDDRLDAIDTLAYWIDLSLPMLFFVLSSLILRFWIKRYILELKELIYGKFSIDYYCWQFFVYRIQMLNNKKLVPVFYSRAYLRYFKSKTYSRIFAANKTNIKKLMSLTELNSIDEYQRCLDNHLDFGNNSVLKGIHKKVVGAHKSKIGLKDNHSEYKDDNLKLYEIDYTILKEKFKQS